MQTNKQHYRVALTIAGSDSGGGAGIQADLKTFAALGVYGSSCVTALTAQNTLGVTDIEAVSQSFMRAQLEAVFSDLRPDAVKTGMLHNKTIIEEVYLAIDKYRPPFLVIDPVMVSTSGSRLIDSEASTEMARLLFPKATLITPNIHEAEAISGIKIASEADMKTAARWLINETGARAVLLKGGHLNGSESVDILMTREQNRSARLAMPYINTRNTHGTGCTLSAAITAYLALGYDLTTSARKAKRYLHRALEAGKNIEIGAGHGSVNHFFAPNKTKIF